MCMIMVIDDDNTILKLFRIILEDLGYDAEFFSNPSDACNRLKSSDFGEFGLILTDYYMPRMNGLEVIDCVRKIERFAKIPILMVTSHDVTIIEQELINSSVDQVSIKPFTSKGMKSALKDFDYLIDKTP